jgi:hypothetical protein
MSPSRNLACVTRYRRFESGFLQRRVSCEPDAPRRQGGSSAAPQPETRVPRGAWDLPWWADLQHPEGAEAKCERQRLLGQPPFSFS